MFVLANILRANSLWMLSRYIFYETESRKRCDVPAPSETADMISALRCVQGPQRANQYYLCINHVQGGDKKQ